MAQLAAHFNQLETLQRLGTSYAGYRLFLATGLFFILLISKDNFSIGGLHPQLYLVISSFYVFLCLINLLCFRYFQKKQSQQIFIYLILDVIHLTAVLFLSSGPNIAIILMYMVVVLGASLLLSTKKALSITLLSIIAVVYQQFFVSLFNGEQIPFIGTSSLMTLVFLGTYAFGQVAVKRMQTMEALTLRQSKAIFQLQNINQSIIEQLDTGFMVIDHQSKITSLNEAARAFLQIPLAMAQRSQDLAQLQPQLHLQLQYHCAQKLRGIFDFALNDEAQTLSIQYRPIASQNQNFTLLIIESRQKLYQQAQQLKLASLGQLSASIAHEIRNPLAAISQANELLMFDARAEDKVLTEMIHKQCLRINRIIEDTLNMSRQKQTLAEQIHLISWFEEFIHDDLSDIQPFLKVDIHQNLMIYFDPHQLRLVLINLIRNAIRHGHEYQAGSLVNIHARLTGDVVLLDVINQGAALSEQQQQNLFAPFYSTSVNGTGLGLYLSKTFCEANHARLKYIPQAQGACFRIECVINQ